MKKVATRCKTRNKDAIRLTDSCVTEEKKNGRGASFVVFSMIWRILCILGIILLLRIFIGLIGSNGSGKTIWMKLLAGLVRQTEGEIYVDGKEIGRKTKAVVSYLQDNPSMSFFIWISSWIDA